eukprot:4803113-Amphidinium_carterae.1
MPLKMCGALRSGTPVFKLVAAVDSGTMYEGDAMDLMAPRFRLECSDSWLHFSRRTPRSSSACGSTTWRCVRQTLSLFARNTSDLL